MGNSIEPKESRRTVAIAAGLIILAAGAAYWNSFTGVLLFDDVPTIEGNESIRCLWPPWRALSPPSNGETVSGRPLLNLSLAINYAVSGTAVWSYHAVNLAIHLAAALLLFGILRRTFDMPGLRDRFGGRGRDAALLLAFAASLLWAVHPLQTESVTYIVQRAESLAGLCYLATLYAVIRGAGSARRAWWYLGSVLACLAGMAVKEVMITAPVVVLLYDRTFLAGSFREALRRRWGLYLGLAATWGLLVYLVVSTGLIYRVPELGAPDRWSYARSQPGVILHYLRLSLWPHPLCLDYGWPAVENWQAIVPAAIGVGLLAAATLWGLAGGRTWGFLGAWFFLILAPSSSLLPLRQLAFEHRIYLPLAAVVTAAMLLGYVAGRTLTARQWLPHSAARPLAVCLIATAALALGMLTCRRNADYQSDLRMWEDTLAKAPYNPRAYNGVGVALFARGQAAEAMTHYRQALELDPRDAFVHNNLGNALCATGRLEEGMTHYRKALESDPRHANALANLGDTLRWLGRHGEAIDYYRRAVEVDPRSAETWFLLGNTLNSQGRADEAVDSYRRALAVRPGLAEAHHNLAAVLAQQQKTEEAILHYRQALAVKPDLAAAHNNLGNLLYNQGQSQAAIVHWREVLRLQPGAMPVLNLMAWVLATSPEASVRNGTEAIELSQQAARLSGHQDLALLDTLAAAYAEAGRFSDAVKTARQGRDLATATRNTGWADTMEKRIRLYESGSPLRELRLTSDRRQGPP